MPDTCLLLLQEHCFTRFNRSVARALQDLLEGDEELPWSQNKVSKHLRKKLFSGAPEIFGNIFQKIVKALNTAKCSLFFFFSSFQGHKAWFMDTRAQLRAAPFIQFTNTICAQLAADLLRQQLITMSTTGTAQRQQVARKEVLKSALWRQGRENRQWQSLQCTWQSTCTKWVMIC